MSTFKQTLPVGYRDALVLADMAPGWRMDVALLLPVSTQAVAGVTDGTSNTIMFGEFAARPAARSEVTRLWNRPSLLERGFGMLLPAVALPLFQAGLWLQAVCLLPSNEQRRQLGATARRTRALQIAGSVANTGGAGAAPGVAGLWFVPRSIIAILIAL